MIYLFLFLILCATMYLAEKANIYKDFFYWFSCIIIIIFNSIRYDLGNDYSAYKHFFENYDFSNLFSLEPFFIFLIFLFKGYKYGYLLFFSITSFLTYLILFFVLKKYKNRLIIITIIFSLEFLFFSNNQISQALSVSLILMLNYFYNNNNRKSYILTVLFTMLFHFSAIIFLPFYFFRIRKYTVHILLSISVFVTFFSKTIIESIYKLIQYIPYYGNLYVGRAKFFNFLNYDSGTNILYYFRLFLACYIVFYYKKYNIKYNFSLVLFLIGVILINTSNGFMPLERLGNSFYYFILIALPIAFENSKKNIHKYSITLILIIWFFILAVTEKNKHGAFPYKTIFNNEISL
jgi:hypothetical protein